MSLFVPMDSNSSNGSLKVLMGPKCPIWILMRLYVFEWVVMVPYRSLFVIMDSNGSLWVLIVPNASFTILMGNYWF